MHAKGMLFLFVFVYNCIIICSEKIHNNDGDPTGHNFVSRHGFIFYYLFEQYQ